MARHSSKSRNHAAASKATKQVVNATPAGSRIPKSMVIRIGAGEVGPSVSQLVRDMRRVMEPHTAVRLKERRRNRLKDYTTMAGPLGVTNLFLFSRSSTGKTNLRLAHTPQGPTLQFEVERYSLCKDIQKSQKHPRGVIESDYFNPPLLVMNNFASPKDSSNDYALDSLGSVTTALFRGLFPPISPQTTPLGSIRRVLLINREPPKDEENGLYTLNLRHYVITTKQVGLSKAIRRINAAERVIRGQKKGKSLPNLSRLQDAADFVLDSGAVDGGYTSASETEVETDAEVEMLDTTRKILNKKKTGASQSVSSHVEKKAVKLVELGPRLRLRLVKVEEGTGAGGDLIWHEAKTKEEIMELNKKLGKNRAIKEARRKEQQENVERKKKEKQGSAQDEAKGQSDEDDWMDEDLEQ